MVSEIKKIPLGYPSDYKSIKEEDRVPVMTSN